MWKAIEKAGPMTKIGYLYNFRQIGQAMPEVLKEYKPKLEEMKNIPALKDTAQSLLDVIEGRRY